MSGLTGNYELEAGNHLDNNHGKQWKGKKKKEKKERKIC